MKKIIFILISAAIFFTACASIQKKSPESSPEIIVPVQVNPDKEFGGIEFGMTKEEVFDVIGSLPDDPSFDINDEIIMYHEQDAFFNEGYGNRSNTMYYFDENEILYKIVCFYYYSLEDSEQEQIQIQTDYASIKSELFERYPIEICTDFHEKKEDAEMTIDTKNRHILMFYYPSAICVSIENVDNTETPDLPES